MTRRKSPQMVRRQGKKVPGARRKARSKKSLKPPAAPLPGGPVAEEGELLDSEEAIRLLRTTRPTFYRWVRSGRLRGMKVGRQWRFRRADLDRFVAGQEPQIDLPVDIEPLNGTLSGKLRAVGGSEPDGEDAAGVRGVVARTIALAVRMRASDIHFEPYEDRVALRFRVDGVLQAIAEFDLRLMPAVAEQIKRMAACDVQERREPQDGRIVIEVDGADLDLRVCVVPALMGEAVTMRILRRDQALISLGKIDYAPADRDRLMRALAAPWGLVVLSGPTGSGKTTVLYACVRHLARPEVKVTTVEDPVEYLIDGAVQVSVRPSAGVTFPRAVRSLLRSDPDIILIGEIRNRDTLQIAYEAALTGHLVMTTLHTDDAAGVLKRMVDIGVEPFVVAGATKFTSAQRLVRRLCPACSRPGEPGADALAGAEELARAGGIDFDALPKAFRRPVGCPECGRTGYRGRTLIVEMLEVGGEIGPALRRGAPVAELRRIAIAAGMTTMGADGVRRAAAGQTTLEEVFRVLSLR